MNGSGNRWKRLGAAFLFAMAVRASADPADSTPLPRPRTDGGMPLMQALRERQSKREIDARLLDAQLLSDLLWAAFGINRPETGHRTAPSGMNAQEMDIFVGLADGVHLYDAKTHQLLRVSMEDIRARTGGGDFVKVAPVALLFVADFARMVKAKPEMKEPYAWNGAGYISQNVYLYCASAGLATVVHEIGDRRPLEEALKLRPEQKIILAQAVGHPGPPRPRPVRK